MVIEKLLQLPRKVPLTEGPSALLGPGYRINTTKDEIGLSVGTSLAGFHEIDDFKWYFLFGRPTGLLPFEGYLHRTIGMVNGRINSVLPSAHLMANGDLFPKLITATNEGGMNHLFEDTSSRCVTRHGMGKTQMLIFIHARANY